MTKKEKLLGFLRDQAKFPLTPNEIALMLDAEDCLSELCTLLYELEDEGKVRRLRGGRFEATKTKGSFCGKFRLNRKGFGFVETDEGDFYISPENCGTALTGDVVRILQITGTSHSREGKITEILERAASTFTGLYKNGKVETNDAPCDIIIAEPSETFENCRVTVKITDYENMRGEVIVNLGLFDSPESALLAIMQKHNVSQDFPESVLAEADKVSDYSLETKGRRDLRSLLTVTIDGADARDLDDAISLKETDTEYTLYVHIADVSHFVRFGGAIDKEAFSRGTSCYFPDRVCPMLPQILSNGVCSLNPAEDRLAVTTEMKISKDGKVLSHEVYESIINSDFRLVYEDVTDMLENEKSEYWEKYEKIRDMLYGMAELSKTLRARRFEKGSMDFNIPEPRIILDSEGKAIDVVPEEHTVSHKIIEEFMLVCNRTLAKHASLSGIPFVYRVHETPDDEKMNDLRKFMSLFDFKLIGKPSGKKLMEILDACKGEPYEKAINTVMLRSMAKAKYDAQNKGHFGLGADFYCHFTSPIRRYPDLVCHRMIKAALNGKDFDSKTIRFTAEAAEQSSVRELEAMDAEREATKLKICEYMEKHLGEEFDAIISSVTSFGFFAELPNCVEGLVRLEDLTDDYYEYDDRTLSLYGKRHGKRYKIGDSVHVSAAGVDREAGFIDFILGGK
ncbi:MAG: ribonuclease R [Clostridia bacterium]|nr:ribonuclease R [Clostridia bacterium]